jgi:hypothetical protein
MTVSEKSMVLLDVTAEKNNRFVDAVEALPIPRKEVRKLLKMFADTKGAIEEFHRAQYADREKISNPIQQFASLDRECRFCGNEMKIRCHYPIPADGRIDGSITQACDNHRDAKGKPTTYVIAWLRFPSITVDELASAGKAIKDRADISEWSKLVAEFKYCQEAEVYYLSDQYGVDVNTHCQDGGLHLLAWWADIASKMPDDDLKHWLSSEYICKTGIQQKMDAILKEELQARILRQGGVAVG